MMRGIAALLLLAAAPAAAVPWTVQPSQSRIGFTATWLGKAVPGSFRSWSAVIDFDAAKPAAARIAVTIDLASVVTGDKTVDGSLPGDDWFDTKAVRTAKFVATKVAAAGPGKFVATGTLTIRGRAVPVTLPFTLKQVGDTATVTGEARVDRRAWQIGVESDAAADYVAFAVPIAVRVVAKRGPAK